jgi:hypothetical protein
MCVVARLATPVALAPVTLPPLPSDHEGFVHRLLLPLRTSGALLVPLPGLQPVCLLAYVTNQGVSGHISRGAGSMGGSQELQREGRQLVWDAAQDRALVVPVCDLDPSSSELLLLVAQGREEVPDVPPLGTSHLKERILKIILHVHALGSVLLAEYAPSCLGSGELLQVHHGCVQEVLGEQEGCDEILMIPSLRGLRLFLHRLCAVLGNGVQLGAFEVPPVAVGPHGLLKVSEEDGPVGAIRSEVGNSCREVLNGGRHDVDSSNDSVYSRKCSEGQRRAHNL